MTDTDDSFLKIYTYIFWNYALEEMGETEDLIQNSKMALTYMAQDKAYKMICFYIGKSQHFYITMLRTLGRARSF